MLALKIAAVWAVCAVVAVAALRVALRRQQVAGKCYCGHPEPLHGPEGCRRCSCWQGRQP